MPDDDPLATEEDLERLRRSIAMLAPGTAAGLDRETAMRVLAEVGDLRSRDRRVRARTPHGLRHAFASAALAARVPVEVVEARLGNTARVVQEVYSHVIPADDRSAAQVVGDLYRTPKEA